MLLSEEGTSNDGISAEDRLIEALMGEAVKEVTKRLVDLPTIEPIADSFSNQWALEISDQDPARDCVKSIGVIDGLTEACRTFAPRLGLDPENEQHLACAGELILETLYVNRLIGKTRTINAGTSMYG